MLNRVEFIGNITKNVELRKTASGKSVANLDIALNYFVGSEKKTEFVQVVVWEKQAEDATNYLSKGRQVHVEAKVVIRKRDIEGKNIPIPEFHADKVLYLGSSNNQNGGSNPHTPNNFQGQQPPQNFGQQDPNPFGSQNNNGEMFNQQNNYNGNGFSPFGR